MQHNLNTYYYAYCCHVEKDFVQNKSLIECKKCHYYIKYINSIHFMPNHDSTNCDLLPTICTYDSAISVLSSG